MPPHTPSSRTNAPRPADEPPEDEALMPWDMRLALCETFDPAKRPDDAAALRAVMNALGAAAFCHRGRCRRAGHCLTPKVECAWRAIPTLRRYVLPALRDIARQRALIGDAPPS